MTAPLRDALAEKDPADAPIWFSAEEANAWASGYNTVLALLVEHRGQVLTHLGMGQVGWHHPTTGRVHASWEPCSSTGCVPVYALTSQGAGAP